LVAVCAFALLCGTPLASARHLAFGDEVTAEATGPGGANVGYDDGGFNCSPPSGALFGLGDTTVSCTDADSNPVGGPTIHVVDTTGPTFSNVPVNISTAATSSAGAVVSYTEPTASDLVDGGRSVDCSPASGSTFPAGVATNVNCTASDSRGNPNSAGFSVTVGPWDSTAPNIGVSDTTVEATSASGAFVHYSVSFSDPDDAVSSSECTPASDAVYNLGDTLVNCSATDSHGNSSSASFTVHVVDTTKPQISNVPSDIFEEATSPSGRTVTFDTPTATDLGASAPVNCVPGSGSNFVVGTTTVTCTANDGRGNTSQAEFHVSISPIDATPPIITVPADITTEATSGSGAAVTYAFSATDPDDAVSASSCTPDSGATFAIGQTTVTCNATDSHTNSASKTFKVTVADTTPPVLSSVPADKTVEANGFAGSIVDFAPPTAVDLGEPRLVTCVPARNSTFALGTTTVICSASDGRGNTGTATFKINVVDTTPPTLNPPGDFSAYAVENSGTFPSDDSVQKFVFGAHVSDIADPHPTLATDTPSFFPVGTTTVHFTATDASGNKATGSARLTILPKPAPGTTPPALPPPTDNTPPANVTGLTGKGGDRRVTLKWTNPKDSGFAAVEIERGTNAAFSSVNATGTVVYHGTGTSYVDKGLTNDVSYRYVVHSVDKKGNKSAGIPINITPHFQPLRTPPDGARLAAIPKKFVWARDPKAAYYNFQLFLGGSLVLQSTDAEPRKILSTWTNGPSLNFKNPWKWEGKSYKIAKGTYTWYVWPGYGARADVKYGPLMGSATFQITKTPKPAKKPAKPKKKKK
jgi:hypothetical protein